MTSLIMKKAGHTFKGDRDDDSGNPLALEDMTDDQLNEWKEIVESLGVKDKLTKLMISQINGEINRRNKRLAIGEI